MNHIHKPLVEHHIYCGERLPHVDCVVTVDGFALDPRLDVRNHSPTGFEWGYGGSGPAQLALAILCHEYGDEVAQHWYQDVKWRVIGALGKDAWTLTSESIQLTIRTLIKERKLKQEG